MTNEKEQPDDVALVITGTCDAIIDDMGGEKRAKFNVGPNAAKRPTGVLAPQVVVMHMTAEEAAKLTVGKVYTIMIAEPFVEEAATGA